jgi:predicted transcriptional regulator
MGRTMTLGDVQKLLGAEVLSGEHLLETEVKTCFACDLISEMLLYTSPNTLLITSLTNLHVLHTAQVMDAVGVVFVGGKKPDASVIMNSVMSNVPLLTTTHLIFECCGLLYAKGMKGDKKRQN